MPLCKSEGKSTIAHELQLPFIADDKVQRFINCMDPGTKVEIHHHPVDEMLIMIRGAIKAILMDDYKIVIDERIIRPTEGVYEVQLPKNVWHTIEMYRT